MSDVRCQTKRIKLNPSHLRSGLRQSIFKGCLEIDAPSFLLRYLQTLQGTYLKTSYDAYE